jgi:hypothetical protein
MQATTNAIEGVPTITVPASQIEAAVCNVTLLTEAVEQ